MDAPLTANELMQFGISSLTAGETLDTCARLREYAPLLWEIADTPGCDLELHYLFYRREMLKLLMGCYTRQVDWKTSNKAAHARGTNESRQDGWSQAQSTQQSTRVSDSCATARYDDVAKGQMRSGSTRAARAEQKDDGFSFTRDEGEGKGRNVNTSHSKAQGEGSQQSDSRACSETAGGGTRSGCKYEFSKSKQKSNGSGATILVAAYGYNSTEGGSTYDSTMSQKAASNQTSTSNGQSSRNNYQDKRSANLTTRDSCSYFNALVDSTQNSKTVGDSSEHSEGFRDQFAHADGAGQSRSKSDARSQQNAQGTSKAHSDGEAERRSDRSAFAQMDDQKAHQRFQHLLELYDNTYQLLQWKRALQRANGQPRIGQMLTSQPDGYCPVGNAPGVLLQIPGRGNASCFTVAREHRC